MAGFQSNYAIDESPDTAINLANGAHSGETELAEDLAIDEEELMRVLDATNAPIGGTVVINDEIIYYHARYKASDLLHLQRGMEGTTPAAHTAGSAVVIYGAPRFGNPAIAQAIIAMQGVITDLKARIAVLESA